MYKNINELIVKYKKKKSKKLLNDIFVILNPIIKKKADYVYYQKKFKSRGRDFKLCNTHKMELGDVLQELNLEVLRIIDNCNINKPFKNYFFTTLWDWRPSFVRTGGFALELKKITESQLNRGGENNIKLENLAFINPAIDNTISIEELFGELTSQQKKVIEILRIDPKIKQSQIAKMIGVTQPRVSIILGELRDKYTARL